jgi:hypothetical protein
MFDAGYMLLYLLEYLSPTDRPNEAAPCSCQDHHPTARPALANQGIEGMMDGFEGKSGGFVLCC